LVVTPKLPLLNVLDLNSFALRIKYRLRLLDSFDKRGGEKYLAG
jgi:hypothetical protein